jgi:RNA polymerase sigma-70 factor (ECF subfamily)
VARTYDAGALTWYDEGGTAINIPDLQSVIERARMGRHAALDELYDGYAPAIHRYCAVRLGDSDAAQDCVQEVFIRVWQHITTFEDRGAPAFQAWLYTIANHVVISHIRRHKRVLQVALTPDLQLPDAASSDVERLLSDRLLVLEALRWLTVEQQHVLALKFFVGMSNAEIAAVLRRSEGAIKALQHRALARLQHLLTNDRTPMRPATE